MHDFPREKLCELINHHGTILCEDAERCEFFLRNACNAEYKREVFVLVNAIREDVAKELLNPPQGLPHEAVFDYLVQRLYDNLWLDKTAAEWTVQTWGIALGVKMATPIPPILKDDLTQRLANQPETPSQSPKAKVSPSFKPLSLINPLDYIRLLWWVLVMPRQLQAYRKSFGKGNEKRIGNWLVSTLTWWPLLIPTLALGLELFPHSAKAWLPETYLLISALFVGCWLLTGSLKINKDVAVGVAVSVVGLVAVGISVSLVGIVTGFVTGGLAIGIVCFIAVSVAGFIAVVVASDIAVVVTGIVAIGVAVGVAIGVTVEIAGFVVGFVVGSVAGFVAGFMVDTVADLIGNTIENTLNTGSPSWLARLAFLLLIAAHFSLIGLYFFEWFLWFNFF
ncbi:MAG: hypothetical protein DRR16_14345 [Candidatus Parabeggiatoa sp. nov. 3]|jgi:hypothetical protein|nr:MAG: hypothetical protein DRR00_19920 [Gammaproteobacteria bacterium]RKZ84554.1 MAG: hypothetical protein DRR16_14345 [Gammaproteobacteria bacterium]HEW98114.1 hypothetical protein [Beggiatoa sp.]